MHVIAVIPAMPVNGKIKVPIPIVPIVFVPITITPITFAFMMIRSGVAILRIVEQRVSNPERPPSQRRYSVNQHPTAKDENPKFGAP
jgi:hypothetical protein